MKIASKQKEDLVRFDNGWSGISKLGGWYKFYRGFCVEMSLASPYFG